MPLQEIFRPSILRVPAYGSEVHSWHGHIPFAFWSIDALRPRIFVELGCHRGDSYLAFCQAVDELSAATRCYAVDTWQGDEHAGRYGDEVYEELRRQHDPRYGRFSRLVRTTFDQARDQFAEGSVDLLHIDGYHEYGVVQHDFESWLSRMSARGVILLHDINVRQEGFGVWRLWDELRGAYPSFAFLHSHGLGVLAVGREVPDAVGALAGLDQEGRREVEDLFARLGEAVRYDLENRRLRAALAERQAEVARLQGQVADLSGLTDRLQQAVEETRRSTSWKITQPLRLLRHLVRRSRSQG